MTQPPRTDPRFARDVAKQLDRRRIRRRLTVWTGLLAAVVAGAMYLRCGHGFGLGGAGEGPGEGAGEGPGSGRPVVGPRRCAIRISPSGTTVDGKPKSRDEVVAACKATAGVDVVITGDTREGDWTELHRALRAAGVAEKEIVVAKPRGR